MKLNKQGLLDAGEWERAGYHLPRFDREAVRERTRRNPVWVHFGAGNIFRAFQANVLQNLLNAGKADYGLIVAEGFDYEIIEQVNRPHDDYSILVTLKADGSVEKTVVGSIVESLVLDTGNGTDFSRMREIFTSPGLQMASFTITEKGYGLRDGRGGLLPDVEYDMKAGPEKPKSYIGKVASLLHARYKAGELPLAMVSMDNCSHNGDKLYGAVSAFAGGWVGNGLADEGFLAYVNDPGKVSFPWSMIDKITPRPDASVEGILRKDGVEGMEAVVTAKHTHAAPFVNAEECEYLVIEDAFPNGRPGLEAGGVLFTDRETVDKVEKMKVCTCLNPLHTALAVYGCLLGYGKISGEMKDGQLKRLAETIGYQEGLPVVVHPGIIEPEEFLRTVLEVRLPNPFLPDTPQRIATDTSQKLAIRFGETIKAYRESPSLEVRDLKKIPLVFAGWLRYLTGMDDTGARFDLSPDPLLGEITPYFETAGFGQAYTAEELRPLLENRGIFGVDLFDVGMADTVAGYLNEMLEAPGAVRRVLGKYV